MSTQEAECENIRHSTESQTGMRAVRLNLGAHSSECDRLSPWRQDLRDGTQASFGKKAHLIVRQIQQVIKDFWRELEQVECLGDPRSEHAQMFGQICSGDETALFK